MRGQAVRPQAGASLPIRAGVTLIVLVAAAIVFRGALSYFFSQDDFAGLARARGLMPALVGPWRYLSGQFYFDLMRVVAGLDPRPYHAVSLFAHLATTALLLALLLRFAAAPAALVGATFFAVHPALYTALYSISGIGEILAAGFGLATILLATHAGRGRWWALPAFAASLACKESTLLLPLALAVLPAGRVAPPPARPALRDPLWLALAACSAAYLVTFLARDVFGVRAGLGAGEAYALRFDGTLAGNLLTYLGWTANFLLPTVRSFSDAVDRGAFGWGIGAGVLLVAGVAARGTRAAGFGFGAALYLVALLPVLPLAHHTYHYYLYAPLLGAAVCVSVALARLGGLRRRTGARRKPGPGTAAGAAWAAAGATVALLTLSSALLVRKIETYPFLRPELRTDPTVDRARIAGNVAAALRGVPLPEGATLRFWSPSSIAEEREAGRDTARESYWETNVRNALLDGLAVRVLRPEVRKVEFVRSFAPAPADVRYAVYSFDGRLRVATSPELDSLMHRFPEAR